SCSSLLSCLSILSICVRFVYTLLIFNDFYFSIIIFLFRFSFLLFVFCFFFLHFCLFFFFFFFSSRRRHTRSLRDWSSDVCSSDLRMGDAEGIELVHSPASCARCTSSIPSASPIRCSTPSRRISRSDPTAAASSPRSEERRVGKEWRARWGREHEKRRTKIT